MTTETETKDETRADILAEMRAPIPAEMGTEPWENEQVHGLLEDYADRFDAAEKRERGNAAVLREALKWVAEFVEDGVDDELSVDGQNLLTAAGKAGAALTAPGRNCDRFQTTKDALDAFISEKEIKEEDVDNMNLHDFFDWLFASAVEGGAE